MDFMTCVKKAKEEETQLRFKMPNGKYSHWVEIKKFKILNAEQTILCFANSSTPFPLTEDAIFADTWEIKEEWYKGNFKEKYPNGVCCDINENTEYNNNIIPVIITDVMYESNETPVFLDALSHEYRYARPLDPEEAPAIIGE